MTWVSCVRRQCGRLHVFRAQVYSFYKLRGSLRLKKGGLEPPVPQEKQSGQSDTRKHDIHHQPCLCMTRQAKHAQCRRFGSQYAYILRERYAWRLQADGNLLN